MPQQHKPQQSTLQHIPVHPQLCLRKEEEEEVEAAAERLWRLVEVGAAAVQLQAQEPWAIGGRAGG